MLETKKAYYRIGEVAKMFQVKKSLIRYWEEEFSFIKPKKSKAGYRLFTPRDIDYFHLIYHLIKERGMTVQGVRDYVKMKKQENNIDKLEVISTLKKTKEFLQDIKTLIEKKEDDDE